jgi:hypothetical protein
MNGRDVLGVVQGGGVQIEGVRDLENVPIRH